MRRREKEFALLQSRLQQGFTSASVGKENKLGLDLLNPLKPAVKPKWKSRGEEELLQRELASQEVSLRAFSTENADLRASLQALFAELQAALQTAPVASVNDDEHATAPEGDCDVFEREVKALEEALSNSEFNEAQLALPFDLVREAAESNFRERLVRLQEQQAQLQRTADVERAARAATVALASSARAVEQKELLLKFVARFNEYVAIVAEQESILRSLVVAVSAAPAAVSTRAAPSDETLLAESIRLSLDAELSQHERYIREARSAVDAERSSQQQSTLQMLRQENELERQRQDLESERLVWQQQRRALEALTVPTTPAKQQQALFATPRRLARDREPDMCVTPTFARLAHTLARAAEVAASVDGL